MHQIRFQTIVLLFLIAWILAMPEAAAQVSAEKPVYTIRDMPTAKNLIVESKVLAKAYRFEEAAQKMELAIEMWGQAMGRKNRTMGSFWNDLGIIRYNQGRYDSAIVKFNLALATYRSVFKGPNGDVALSFNNLGNCYSAKDDFAQARHFHYLGLDMALKLKGEERFLGILYDNLGHDYQDLAKFDSARAYYQYALDLRLKTNGEESDDVASSYSNLGSVCNSLGLYPLALDYHRRSIAFYRKLHGNDQLALANPYAGIATYYMVLGDFNQALDFFEKSLALRIKYLGEQHPETDDAYNNIAWAFEAKGDYSRAIENYQHAVSIIHNLYGEEHPKLASFYGNLGVVYSYTGDNGRAISYQERALNICLKVWGSKYPRTAYCYHNLGAEYASQKEYDRAIIYFERALEVFLELNPTNNNVATAYDNLADCYGGKNAQTTAADYYSRALQIRRQLFGEEHPEIARSYDNLGYTYFCSGDLKQAFEYYRQGLALRLKLLGPAHPLVSVSYAHLGAAFQKEKKYDQADTAYLQALFALNYRGPDSLKLISSMPELLHLLDTIGVMQTAWYQSTGDVSHLHAARQHYSEALAALDYQSKSLSPASKSTLAAQAQDICTGALSADYALYRRTDSLHWLREGFDFAERSKAFLLYEAIKESNALAFAGIPPDLLQQESDLRVDIAYYEKKLHEKAAPDLNRSDADARSITDTLFERNRRADALKKRFEDEYKKYYRAKYDLATVSLDYVQDTLLQPNQTLLEYVVGDSSVFLFLVQKDHFEVKEIKKDFPLEQWVEDMTRRGIYAYYTLPPEQRLIPLSNSVDTYTEAAVQLYQKLLAPVESRLTENLLVIPDGALGYVPFEAMLTKTPARSGVFTTYDFLVKEHRISYCYSATLLREMCDKKDRTRPPQQLLAMAPFFTGDVRQLRDNGQDALSLRDSLNSLPASGEEVAGIAKRWKGTALYGTEATAAVFKRDAPQYRMLHLSTHGQADDRLGDYAFLAFGASGDRYKFGKLYARDLYNLKLNADLVVLSACETGTGKLQRGEGIVSLARAFAYAGAGSIVTTLWKVNDEKTRDLILDFYTYLQKPGTTKDEALRSAKLHFLEANGGNGGGTLHPFFWAGFIAIGDMSALK